MGFDNNHFGGLVNQGKVRQIMEYLSQTPEEVEFLQDYVRIYEKEDYPPLGKEEGLEDILLCSLCGKTHRSRHVTPLRLWLL